MDMKVVMICTEYISSKQKHYFQNFNIRTDAEEVNQHWPSERRWCWYDVWSELVMTWSVVPFLPLLSTNPTERDLSILCLCIRDAKYTVTIGKNFPFPMMSLTKSKPSLQKKTSPSWPTSSHFLNGLQERLSLLPLSLVSLTLIPLFPIIPSSHSLRRMHPLTMLNIQIFLQSIFWWVLIQSRWRDFSRWTSLGHQW